MRLVSVAGTTFHEEAVRRAVARGPATPPVLVAEPDNAHDPNAVRVEIGGERVGYWPRGRSVRLDARMCVCKLGLEPAHVWLAVEC